MKRVNVLDVTLRDGGCVNNFNFGDSYISQILSSLEQSNVEIIELGYLDNPNGSLLNRTQYLNELVIKNAILKEKKPKIIYVAMMDYGKFNVDDLQYNDGNGIDGIRLAFHKKNVDDIFSVAKTILKKGYALFLQPMITMRYTDVEFIDLITRVNAELPETSALYVVDSFGEMRANDVARLFGLADHALAPSMALGFHSHNNLQLSYANAISILQYPTKRNIILDASIMGMGKGAGNLNTELLLEHLNMYYDGQYNILPLLEVMDRVINPLHDEYHWGYSPEYYLSSINHCSPSYASYFYDKHMLPIDQVGELLSLIDETKKISFDKSYAEFLYCKYNEQQKVNDAAGVSAIKNILKDKDVLLIAPGKSVNNYFEVINDIASKENVITIGLNYKGDFNTDFLMITRKEAYDRFSSGDNNLIVSSAITKAIGSNHYVINYGDWIEADSVTHDSAGFILINLIRKCEVKKIYLAGFDGFSSNINENYCNDNLKRPVTEKQATQRNDSFKLFIKKIEGEGIHVEFITPSKYKAN